MGGIDSSGTGISFRSPQAGHSRSSSSSNHLSGSSVFTPVPSRNEGEDAARPARPQRGFEAYPDLAALRVTPYFPYRRRARDTGPMAPTGRMTCVGQSIEQLIG